MSDIPPKIINNLLSRLPVKSLLRFRCVSKPWCSLIDGKDFINLHLRRSSETNTNRTLLVDSRKTEPVCVDLDCFELLDIGDLRFGFDTVVGCCNGLVLIESRSGDNIRLWNPATRKVNKLPASPLKIRASYGVIFAFGYDSKRDDYKVVRVVEANDRVGEDDSVSLCLEAKIYSLNSNSWKSVENFPYILPDERRWGVYLHDALHTVVKRSHNSEEVIMAFDLGKEDHLELPLPEFTSDGCLASLEVIRRCLATVVPGKEASSEIWLMKEYGVKDSWIKILRFEHPIPRARFYLCPLAFSKSGDEILIDYNGIRLNWYDLRRETVQVTFESMDRPSSLSASFDATVLPSPFRADVGVGSLVLPFSPAAVATGKQTGGQGEKGKEMKEKRDDFL